jgi:hypothetical protein
VDKLIEYVLREMKVIGHAPVAFFAAVLVLAGGMWWAMDWGYGRVIANRDSEISNLKTQRDEYKDKLSGATPDQAAQRVSALEIRIRQLDPKPQRHLTEDQKKKLVDGLTKLAVDIPEIAVFAEAAREPARFAVEFMDVFKKAGISPLGPISTIPNFVSETGILVGLIDPEKPSELANKYIEVLRSTGLKLKQQNGKW